MTDYFEMAAECERLRKLAHEAPLAKIGERHTGERHIIAHTSAWARLGNEWLRACEKRDREARA